MHMYEVGKVYQASRLAAREPLGQVKIAVKTLDLVTALCGNSSRPWEGLKLLCTRAVSTSFIRSIRVLIPTAEEALKDLEEFKIAVKKDCRKRQ